MRSEIGTVERRLSPFDCVEVFRYGLPFPVAIELAEQAGEGPGKLGTVRRPDRSHRNPILTEDFESYSLANFHRELRLSENPEVRMAMSVDESRSDYESGTVDLLTAAEHAVYGDDAITLNRYVTLESGPPASVDNSAIPEDDRRCIHRCLIT
jgi:hypothetical protein